MMYPKKESHRIVIDRNIPFIQGVFESVGAEVIYSDNIEPSDADALIIRTRTRCNKEFLHNHKPKIIATATIGFDHINIEYCQKRGIVVATAAGCNARGVAQWVFAALLAMGIKEPKEYRLGVVGVGNVGSVVARIAQNMGFELLLCDPPRAEQGEEGFIAIDQIFESSDIITLHLPLNSSTHDIVSKKLLDKLSSKTILINSSRGEVINESVLMSSKAERLALDVWQNEPQINKLLLEKAEIATPHIAGYSLQGKAMGSAMAVRSVAQVLHIPELMEWYPAEVPPILPRENFTWKELQEQMPLYYNIMEDDRRLRAGVAEFERQRCEYRYRQEWF